MATRPTGIWGIDFQKESICIASYSPETGSIASVGIRLLSEGSGDWWKTIKSEFNQLVSELKLNNDDAVCSLPAEWAIVKRLMLDSDEEQVEEALTWELSQQIIGSVDQYVFDFQKLAGESGSHQSYLAVAYRGDAVDRITDLVRSYRLNPLIIDLDVFALINLFEVNYQDRISVPALIVFGDSEKLTLCLCQSGEYIDIEILPCASTTNPEEVLQSVLRACGVLFASNPSFSLEQLGGVYITGPLCSRKEIADILINNLPKTEALNPFRTIECRAAVSPEDLGKYAPQLAVAIGLAVRGGTERAHD